MGIRRKTIGGVTVLGLVGEFYGGDETDQLSQAIADELAAGNTRMVLDLSQCSMMSSATLSVLVGAHKAYAERHAAVKLCGLQQRMTNMLITTRLINVFGHHPTVEAAISAFAESAAGA